jgi:group I intron endonuclease
MLYLPTIMSILEVLAVTIPVLLAVAFVTIAERKTMASMQRRLGPNSVGWYGTLQAFKGKQVRHFHTTRLLHNKPESYADNDNSSSIIFTNAIKGLYKDRLAPVKVFSDKILFSCSNILDIKERSDFFKEIDNKGGIYIIQYKHDSLVYYIGRTIMFSNRLRSHIKHKKTDKFHVFANMVGWDNFTIGIVEICNADLQGIRENYYLQKYLPLLNSTFFSKYSEIAILKTLSSILLSKKPLEVQTSISTNIREKVTIWVYKLCTTHVEKTFVKYDSLNKASKGTGPCRDSIQRYLNTNVPIKGFLYYTSPIEHFNAAFNLAKSSFNELKIDGNLSKKVWVYTIKNGEVILVNNQPFSSREQVAKFLNTIHGIVRYYIDSWKSQGLNGYYLFNNPLDSAQFNSLLELSKEKPISSKISVWVYNAKTMELINDTPFPSMQKCADYFKLDYRTISIHLDTMLATFKNEMLVYFFSSEAGFEVKKELLLATKKATNVTTKLWVYKKVDGKYNLIGDNQPFSSKLQACKALNISPKTIAKFIDSHNSYKELFFFSEKISLL